MKKILIIILGVIMSMVYIVGCSKNMNGISTDTPSSQNTVSTTDASNQKDIIVLDGWGAYAFDDSTSHTSYNDQMIWDIIEEKLGVRVNWTTVTTAGGNQNTQFGILMASGNLPDFIVDINPATLEQYGMRGALIDHTDYIYQYMPDFVDLLDKDIEALGSITSVNNGIYFLPRLLNEKELRFWCGYAIRGDWLEKLNEEPPTTTDGFEALLTRFKNEIEGCDKPFTGTMSDVKSFIWSFGVGSRGTGNGQDDYFIEDGKIKFGPTDPRYKDAVEYIRGLVAKGLIDSDWVSLSNDQRRSNMLTGVSGVTMGSFSGILTTFNSLFEADGKGKPLTSFAPLIGPSGYSGTQGMHTSIDLGFGGAITSACSNPEAAAKLFNYTYSEEGRKLLYYGIENITYTTLPDGSLAYTEQVTSNDLGILAWLKEYVANVSCYPSALLPSHYYATLSDEGIAANQLTTAAASKEDALKVPAIRFSVEEANEVTSILTDINSYVDENFVAFVNGTKDMSQWDSFIAGFDSLRLNRLNAIYEAAYERFLKHSK